MNLCERCGQPNPDNVAMCQTCSAPLHGGGDSPHILKDLEFVEFRSPGTGQAVDYYERDENSMELARALESTLASASASSNSLPMKTSTGVAVRTAPVYERAPDTPVPPCDHPSGAHTPACMVIKRPARRELDLEYGPDSVDDGLTEVTGDLAPAFEHAVETALSGSFEVSNEVERASEVDLSDLDFAQLQHVDQILEEVDAAPALPHSQKAPPRYRLFVGIALGTAVALAAMIALVVVLPSLGPERTEASEVGVADPEPMSATSTDVVGAALLPSAPVPTVPDRFVVKVAAEPASATIDVDGKVVGTGNFTSRFVADGERHQLIVRAEGFETFRAAFVDAAPSEHVVLRPTAEPSDDRETATPADSARGRGPQWRPLSPEERRRARRAAAADRAPEVTPVAKPKRRLKRKSTDEGWGEDLGSVDTPDPWK